MPAISIQDIKKLTVAERIVLVERIWESIPEESDELDLTVSQKRELDHRLKSIRNNTAKFTTWPDVRVKIRDKLREKRGFGLLRKIAFVF
jgi:putative addiction module component (TIGR02574 family)